MKCRRCHQDIDIQKSAFLITVDINEEMEYVFDTVDSKKCKESDCVVHLAADNQCTKVRSGYKREIALILGTQGTWGMEYLD